MCLHMCVQLQIRYVELQVRDGIEFDVYVSLSLCVLPVHAARGPDSQKTLASWTEQTLCDVKFSDGGIESDLLEAPLRLFSILHLLASTAILGRLLSCSCRLLPYSTSTSTSTSHNISIQTSVDEAFECQCRAPPTRQDRDTRSPHHLRYGRTCLCLCPLQTPAS